MTGVSTSYYYIFRAIISANERSSSACASASVKSVSQSVSRSVGQSKMVVSWVEYSNVSSKYVKLELNITRYI